MKKCIPALLALLTATLTSQAQIGTNGTGTVNGVFIGPDVSLDYNTPSLIGTDLSGANLSGATLTYTWLTSVNLTDAVFSNAVLNGVNFENANLSGAHLTNATLTNIRSGSIIGITASLPIDWQLISGHLIGPTANLNDALLVGADLSGINFSGINLKGADLTDTILSNASFSGATDLRADFTGADLYGVNLDGGDLSDAILNGVQSGGITGTPAALPAGWQLSNGYLIGIGANLAGADLGGVDLSAFDLTGVLSGGITGTPVALPAGWMLYNGYLMGAGAVLTGADLSGIDLSGFNLSNADLSGANLSGADLKTTDLTGARLYNANLSGADVAGTWLDFNSKSTQEEINALQSALSNAYTLAEISDLRPGSSMIAVSNGMATIGFAIDQSTNLVDWIAVTNTATATLPADAGTRFFRSGAGSQARRKTVCLRALPWPDPRLQRYGTTAFWPGFIRAGATTESAVPDLDSDQW